MTQQLSITDDVSVNRQLMRQQNLKKFSSLLLAAAARMESIEKWTFDDLILNSAGEAIGVNDERGTGEERMRVLVKFQSGLNTQQWDRYIASGTYSEVIDKSLIKILSKIKTRRFLVACYFIDQKNKNYMKHLLDMVLKADPMDIEAHVLRSRLDRLNKMNVIQSIFSDESVAQVRAVFDALKEST